MEPVDHQQAPLISRVCTIYQELYGTVGVHLMEEVQRFHAASAKSSALASLLPNKYTEEEKLLGNKEEGVESNTREEICLGCRKLLPTVSPGLVSAASMS